jgi:hypothetical protein
MFIDEEILTSMNHGTGVLAPQVRRSYCSAHFVDVLSFLEISRGF